MQLMYRARWRSRNAADLSSGGAQLEFQQGHQLSLGKFIAILLCATGQMAGKYQKQTTISPFQNLYN
jgi:hypothetical protein